MAVGYRVEVRGEWGGIVDANWRPAISGTVNQTDSSDAWSSTEDTHEAAQEMLERMCLSLVSSDPEDGDPRDNAPRFRIVEVPKISIKMTVEETKIYDGKDGSKWEPISRDLLARAVALAKETGGPVEIYTHDGITWEQVTASGGR